MLAVGFWKLSGNALHFILYQTTLVLFVCTCSSFADCIFKELWVSVMYASVKESMFKTVEESSMEQLTSKIYSHTHVCCQNSHTGQSCQHLKF